LIAVIEPLYPEGQLGRPPIGLERMLRVYFLRQWPTEWASGLPTWVQRQAG
jgi:hypothetical protein